MNPAPNPPLIPQPSPARRFPRGLILLISGAAVLAAGFNILMSGSFRSGMPAAADIPVKSVISQDVELTERGGKTVRMSELRGKVVACAYVYTVCPHGCAAVMGEMKRLLERFRGRHDFHLVSMAVLPEHDTTEFLSAYADGLGLTAADPWWFLTGERAKIWSFMDSQLRLTPAVPIPEDQRLNPLDTYDHDLRIVLIDRQSRVRGYYSVFHPQTEVAEMMCEKLERDACVLLDTP